MQATKSQSQYSFKLQSTMIRDIFSGIIASNDMHIGVCRGYLQLECRVCDVLFAYENIYTVSLV